MPDRFNDHRLRFGLFELDLETGELTKEGRPIRLQAQPARVLAYLAGRAGEVVTRQELQQHIWGNSYVEFDQGLNFCIRRIRVALGDRPNEPTFIETIPRCGYRFIAPVRSNVEAALDIRPSRRLGKLLWVAAAVVILAAGSLVLLLARRSENTSQRRVALAVLPFEDLGPDPVPDYFVDGLNEELITALSRVDPPRLGVIARSSVMRFRASAAPADQIGRDLGADYLLTGSFRFQDGRARISAQLIRTSDQTNIWGQSYDHAIADVLDVEREIAQAAARSLPIEPGVGGEEAKPTNPAARDAYLKGRYFLARGGAGPTAKALELFQQALQSDPGYAPAYLGKAEALLKQEVAAPEVEPEARALVRRALDLDDRSAEGHMLLARMKLFFDLDWPAARREFERAIELEPGRALTYHNYAFYFSTLGLHEQAIDQLQKALELDPVSPALKGDLGWIYYYAGRYDEAIEQAFNTLQLQGEDLSARVCLIHCYLRQNNIAAALGRAREVMRLMGAAPGEIEALDRNDPAGGIRAYAGWRLKMFSEQATREYVDPALFAQAYLYLGRPDRAIAYLEAAHRLRSFAMAFLKTDPRYDSIRSDPRFARLVREVTAKAVESY